MKSRKYRIYPNKEQQQLLDQNFGNARFVYNRGLTTRKSMYGKWEKCNYHTLATNLIQLKKDNDWLKLSWSQTLQQSLKNVERAYKNFFNKNAKYPRFKNKYDKQSITYPQHTKIIDWKIVIPKLWVVKTKLHRECLWTIKRMTIIKTATWKYYVSVTTDYEVGKPTTNGSVWIDVGIKEFATLSDWTQIANPKFLRTSLRRLKKQQRKLSRKKKWSTNSNKQRLKVAILHEKVSNQRKDFLHKVSTMIANKYHTIAIEDLNVKGMMKNHCLAQAIGDVSWSAFYTMLYYKTNKVVKVDRFAPSTKTCSNCWSVQSMKLNNRTFRCEVCWYKEDRDVNAAINILAMATD